MLACVVRRESGAVFSRYVYGLVGDGVRSGQGFGMLEKENDRLWTLDLVIAWPDFYVVTPSHCSHRYPSSALSRPG